MTCFEQFALNSKFIEFSIVLLTITNETSPATDLGFLLHKNPSRAHSKQLTFCTAHIFYSEVSEKRCTACLLIDVDPISLVRKEGQENTGEHYVNDRPYAATSFLSTAIAKTMGTALSGRCKERPELAEKVLALTVEIPVLPCRGGEELLRKLFEPIGYQVTARSGLLDEKFPDWGGSPYFAVRLSTNATISSMLSHMHVLIPVLDDDKHYWVAQGEVENLLKRGEGWLPSHPERELILRRALKNQRDLVGPAMERLAAIEDAQPGVPAKSSDEFEVVLERHIGLAERRLNQVAAVIKETGAKRVVDLGCGEGKLVLSLIKDSQFTEVVGMDVAQSSLKKAAKRLDFLNLPPLVRERFKLIQGSLLYRDMRLSGFDTATLVEVIEHLDAARLTTLEKVVFGFARPQTVIVTTPNVEYNRLFSKLPVGRMRHRDHRFEWTRVEFSNWAERVANQHGYTCEFRPVGDEDKNLGAPTQMAIFRQNVKS